MGNHNSGRKRWYTFENEYDDLTGRTFGSWTVVSRAENNRWKQIMWHCVCACGYKARIVGKSLREGGSTNCGCIARKKLSERMKKQWADGLFKRTTKSEKKSWYS